MTASVDFLRRNATIGLAYVLAVVLFIVGTIHSTDFGSANHIRNIVVAASFEREANRLVWIVPLIIGIAIVVGLVNGIGVAYAGVPPIIMTLGMNGALQGLLLIYTDGGRASAPPPGLVDFVNGRTLGIPTQVP